MVDWTVVLTAGITGALGYFGARLQARVSGLQVDLEHARYETERAERLLEARRELYLRVLASNANVRTAMTQGKQLDEFTQRDAEFERLQLELLLLGSDEVGEATGGFGTLLHEFDEGMRRSEGTGSYEERRTKAYAAIRERDIENRKALVWAMRIDLGVSQ